MRDRREEASGRIGEELAAQYLQQKGYAILSRNVHCGHGELDIVCRDGDEIVFVEVKTRRSLDGTQPEDLISLRQERMLKHTADAYLQEYVTDFLPTRFDIVCVEEREGGYTLRHIPNTLTA